MRLKIRLRLPAQTHGFVRWSRRLFFAIGVLALAYVGFTLLDARLYQASAERSLETQIQVEREHRVGVAMPSAQPAMEPATRPALKKGDVLGLMDIPVPREMTGHSIVHANAARAAE